MLELFETGKDSDVTFICGHQSFKVHRLQLALHSVVFDAMLNGRFKVDRLLICASKPFR